MLLRADELGFGRRGPIDATAARAYHPGHRAGRHPAPRPRPPGRRLRVGKAAHRRRELAGLRSQARRTGVARRVRIYPYARAASPEARDRLARTAQREFRVLEGIEHQGIQRVLDYREAELGPALIFEHDPDVSSARSIPRAESTRPCSLAERLALVRQLGEAMAFAHGKRLYHRGLAPQNILVRNPDSDTPRLQITNWQVASRGEGSSAGMAMTTGTRARRRTSIRPGEALFRARGWRGKRRRRGAGRCLLARRDRLPHLRRSPARRQPARSARPAARRQRPAALRRR